MRRERVASESDPLDVVTDLSVGVVRRVEVGPEGVKRVMPLVVCEVVTTNSVTGEKRRVEVGFEPESFVFLVREGTRCWEELFVDMPHE